jgi:hypothetical protein
MPLAILPILLKIKEGEIRFRGSLVTIGRLMQKNAKLESPCGANEGWANT